MIHYSITGKGQPVVLIHGFPNSSNSWQPIAARLEHAFQLYLPDLPGAGKSQPSDQPLTMEIMAESINRMLERENLTKVLIAGHSMGGYTAMAFAARYPEKVAGIAMVHSLANTDSEAKKENRRKAIALMSKGSTEQETFLRGMAQNLFAASFTIAHPEVVKSIVANGMHCSPASLAAFYTAIMQREDHLDVLRQAPFPLQWIIGDEDTATPLEAAMKQAHIADTNKIAVYRPCGHMSMLEHPERLAQDLSDFFTYCHSK